MPGKRQGKMTAKTAGSPTGKKMKRQRSMENFTAKPKALRSFSLRSPQRIRGSSTNKKIQQTVPNGTEEFSSSTNAEWQSYTDEFESDLSMEQMRSSEMPNSDSEFDFRKADDFVISSTPFSFSKQQSLHFTVNPEDLTIPDVSYTTEEEEENYTLKAANFSLKSLSPEKNLQVPPIPEEDNETVSVFQFSDDPETEDQLVSQAFGKDEGGVDILTKLPNHDRQGRFNDEVEPSCKDRNALNSGDNFEDNTRIRNTETPKKKGKLYRGVGMRSNSRMGRLLRKKVKENSFEDINKRDSEDSFEAGQSIQKEELPLDSLENHPKETISQEEERICNDRVRIGNKTKQYVASNPSRFQFSSSSRMKHVIEERNSLKDTNREDDTDSTETVLNIYNAVAAGDPPETTTHQVKRKYNKRVKVVPKMKLDVSTNLNMPRNSTSSRMKHVIEEKKSNLGDDEDSIETVLNIHNVIPERYSPDSTTHEGKTNNVSLGKGNKTEQDVVTNLNRSQNYRSFIKKHITGESDSFEDLNQDDDVDYIEEAPNMQNEERNSSENINRDDVDNNETAPNMQNEERNSSEDMNRDDVDNIEIAPSMLNEERNSSENMNRDDVDNIETAPSMQNEEMSVGYPPETTTHQGKRKYNKLGNKVKQNLVDNRNVSQNSTLIRSKYTIEERNSFEDMNRDDVNNIETAPSMQNEEMTVGYPIETTTHQGKRKYNKLGNKVKQNLVDNQKGSQNSTLIRSKHTIEERSSFEDMNLVGNEEGFQNVQNIQKEDSQVGVLDKTQPETASNQKRRKFFSFSRSDNRTKQNGHIRNVSQNSKQKKNKKKKVVEKSCKGVYDYTSEEDLEPHITRTNVSPQKQQIPGESVKRSNLRTKATKQSRASKISEDQEASEYDENRQHEGEKLEWPLCCLTSSRQTFSILKPVMRYDVPIDSLTMLGLRTKTKEKCKH